MFAILSEINCLDVINDLGVYPDEFYTDFDTFKNRAVNFNNATVVVILAGSCAFNKRLTIELYKNMEKRAENPKDSGIVNVFMISDSRLTMLKKYYKFTGDMKKMTIVENDKEKKEQIDFWNKFDTQPHKAEIYLSKYDKGIDEDAKEAYEHRFNTEDEYVKLITVPNVKEMLSARK